MIEENKNHGVYFSEEKDPFDIIIEILKNNNLSENFAEGLKKTMAGKISRIEELYKLTIRLAEEKITEKDFVLSLQKQLGVNPNVAENLNKNIKSMFLPYVVKVKLEEQKMQPIESIESNVLPKIKPPLGVEKILAEQQRKSLGEKIIKSPIGPVADEVITPTPRKKSKLPQEPISEKPIPKQLKKQDLYRESIE